MARNPEEELLIATLPWQEYLDQQETTRDGAAAEKREQEAPTDAPEPGDPH